MGLRIVATGLLLALAAAPAALAADEPDEPITSVTIENRSAAERPAGPVTFGMVFAKGDVPRRTIPQARGHDTPVDIKRRWPDGSVKHAILTVALPELPAKNKTRLGLVAAPAPPMIPGPAKPIRATEHLPKDLDLTVRFEIHDGPTRTASLRKTIERGGASDGSGVWLYGLPGLYDEEVPRLATEFLLKTVPVDKDGQPDPDLEVRFHVRHYESTKSTRVAVVVENCHWKSPGNIPYDVTVVRDGKQLYARKEAGRWDGYKREKKYIGHPKWARWVKRFWIGRPLDDVHVRYDVAYLNRTGLLPRYDTSLTVPEAALAKLAGRWKKARTEILQNGFILPYFPTTGGRADIGPLPRWTARYLVSQDPRALEVVLGLGDLSGSCPVHFREAKTDFPPTLDDHPTYSLNRRGTRERIKPRDTTDTPWVMKPGSHFHVDGAHQPSLAYVPYLVTGDYYYLEEMWFWANYNMIRIHYQYRDQAAGLLIPNQTRGEAWTLRNLLHPAALSPDGSKAKTYFEAKLRSNLQRYNAFTKSDRATPIGTYTMGATHAYTRGWDPKIRGKYYSMPGWQHNFLAWCMAHVCDHGYDANAIRDYLMKWTIGSFTHPDEITPYAGTAYFVFVGERLPDKTARWCRTWKEVSELTYEAPGPKRKKPKSVSYPRFGGSYSYIARAVLLEATRSGHPQRDKAVEALDWLNGELPARIEVMAANPKWAFEPPDDNLR
ncbi:MAG: hypothetical protein R6V58_05320 [Planctomycetota bacterium]